MREQLVYRLDGIDAEAGVDVSEIAGVLLQFAQLVRGANQVLDLGMSVDVRVKPFREGSWITEFILHGSLVQDLLQYFKTADGQDVKLLIELLGLSTGGAIVGVAKIVKFTRGKVEQFHNNNDSTVTYSNEAGEELTVTLPEHVLVQSPIIQNTYYNTFIAPLGQFPTATAVEIGVVDEEPVRFTADDKPAFDEYAAAVLDDASTENVTSAHGIWLKPHRGSYAGEGTRYSFDMDGTALWPVTIADEAFLERLRSGDVRLHSEDSLKVDLEINQRLSARHTVTGSRYTITHVLEYVEYEAPQQLRMHHHDA